MRTECQRYLSIFSKWGEKRCLPCLTRNQFELFQKEFLGHQWQRQGAHGNEKNIKILRFSIKNRDSSFELLMTLCRINFAGPDFRAFTCPTYTDAQWLSFHCRWIGLDNPFCMVKSIISMISLIANAFHLQPKDCLFLKSLITFPFTQMPLCSNHLQLLGTLMQWFSTLTHRYNYPGNFGKCCLQVFILQILIELVCRVAWAFRKSCF